MRNASIGRRSFVGLLGSAAAWPLIAQAQTGVPVIGFLSSLSAQVTARRVVSFGQGLKETGYTLEKNVSIEVRLAEGQYDRLPRLAAELVAGKVKLIATLAAPAANAAKAATSTIPIVFVSADDPVKAGLVSSLNRPGGNVTGISFIALSLGTKRLDLLRELIPNTATVAILTNPSSPAPVQELSDLRDAARAIGLRLLVFRATSADEIDQAFAAIGEQGIGAVLIGSDAFLSERSEQIVALAARHRVPTLYYSDEAVTAGGLVSYGASIANAWRLAGVYAGRILQGESPAMLPVQQSTKLHLVVNLKTARALKLSVAESLLLRADEVIE